MKRWTGRLISLLLCVMLLASVAAPALAAQKISNPDNPRYPGDATGPLRPTGLFPPIIDGIDPDPAVGRHNSYAWCSEIFNQTDGDYLWVGTNRDLGALVFTQSGQDPRFMEWVDIPIPSEDAAGKIYRIRLSDPEAQWEFIYEDPVINGYRRMFIFNDDLYVAAGMSNRQHGNYSVVLRFSKDFVPGDFPEIVFWETFAGPRLEHFRSVAIMDDILYIGTFDGRIFRTDGTGLQNLTPNHGVGDIGWTQIAYTLELPDVAGLTVWDMLAFNGSLYAFLLTTGTGGFGGGGGFEVLKFTPDGDGGYDLEIIVGGDGALYPFGLGMPRNVTASPFLSTAFGEEYVYVTTFSNGPGFIGGMAVGDHVHVTENFFLPAQVYRFCADDVWEVVVGDRPGESEFIAVDKEGIPVPFAEGSNQRAGFFLQDDFLNISFNLYNWWMAEHNGKLYVTTWDVSHYNETHQRMLFLAMIDLVGGPTGEVYGHLERILELFEMIFGEGLEGLEVFLAELEEFVMDLARDIQSGEPINQELVLAEFFLIMTRLLIRAGITPAQAATIMEELTLVTGELIEALAATGVEPDEVVDLLVAHYTTIILFFSDRTNPIGFDMFVSEDGVHFEPVTVDGFGNPYNYGGRVLTPSEHGLFVLTANPFAGGEVWRYDDFKADLYPNAPKNARIYQDETVTATVLVTDAPAVGAPVLMAYESDLVTAAIQRRPDSIPVTDIRWDNQIRLSEDTGRPYYYVVEEEIVFLNDMYDIVITPEPGVTGSEALVLEFTAGEHEAAVTINITVQPGNAPVVDKSAIREVLTREVLNLTPGAHTSASWMPFAIARTAVQEVQNDRYATQAQVDGALDVLREAIDNLEIFDRAPFLALVAHARTLRAMDYTPFSWGRFQIAFVVAEVAAHPFATPDQVANSMVALNNQINALVPLVADKTPLRERLDEAEALNQADYTPESWADFVTARDGAQAVYDEAAPLVSSVADALSTLTDAMGALERAAEPTPTPTPPPPPPPPVGVDKSALSALLEVVDSLDQAYYSAASWAQLAIWRDSARGVNDNEDASQSSVDMMLSALMGAVNGLVLVEASPPADKALLRAVLAATANLNQADYTQESWTNFVIWRDAASAVYSDEAALQPSVDSVFAILTVSLNNLVLAPPAPTPTPTPPYPPPPPPPPEVDRASLGTELARAEGLNQVEYTSGSWASLVTARDNAKAVYEDESALQPAVDSALAALTGAISNLVRAGGGNISTPSGRAGGAATVIEAEDPEVPAAPEPDPDPAAGAPAILFTDVHNGAWFAEAVAHVAENGLFMGTAEGVFSPNVNMTRAMFVTVLGRLAQQLGETTTGFDNPFADVRPGQWYTSFVAWAAANDIVSGYDATTFGPNDPITREQMAALFIRFTDYMGIDISAGSALPFTDAPLISAWAGRYVDAASAGGLIQGDGGRFRPRDTATRAEVAIMFLRLNNA